MNRHLVLISNPGNPKDDNYVKTTQDAIDRWEAFFRSPIGGYWRDEEISKYGESNPINVDSFNRIMIPLNTVQCDYSIIVFCGHGCCTADGMDAIQLPIPDKNNYNLLPVDSLFGNGSSFIRRTVILDACRSLIHYPSNLLFEQRHYSSIYTIDGIECGNYYNALIMQAQPHVEILYSTSEHHKAYGSMEGSQYADAMSSIVRRNSIHWKQLAINDKYGHFHYTMCDLQRDLTSDLVGRKVQVPEYIILGMANLSFPFVAMHLPTSRALYNDDAMIEVIND